MKIELERPSGAMAVACTALFVALGGTGIAAVNFARNAGAVDGKSAVAASSTVSHAAGRLVATNSRGPDKGQIPGKFLAGVPGASTFGTAFGVADNATGAPVALASAPGIGSLSATCVDQNARPGVEDPATVVSFANSSGATINMARRRGGDDATVEPQAPATQSTISIGGSNTFQFHVQHQNVDLLIDGVVRQDGRGTANANCVFYGTFVRVG